MLQTKIRRRYNLPVSVPWPAANLTFDQVLADTLGGWDSNFPEWITIPNSGYYNISAYLIYEPQAGFSDIKVYLLRNAASLVLDHRTQTNSDARLVSFCQEQVALTAGDKIIVQLATADQGSGAFAKVVSSQISETLLTAYATLRVWQN